MRINLVLIAGILLQVVAICIGKENNVKITNLQAPDNCKDDLKAGKGKWIMVHFSASVDDSSKAGKAGQVFQNSKEVGLPIVVQLAEKEVVPGWIVGLEGLCESSNVTLVVSPEMGYGDDLTMRFDIEILQVSDSEIQEPSLFDLIDADVDGQISLTEFEHHFKARSSELDENGEAPLGLFMKDDVNQNAFLNWEEFSGPKGTSPPSTAQKIITKEKADPELTRFKKGDPLEIRIKDPLGKRVNGNQKDQETDEL
jgi:hypothetical protein